MKRFVLAGVAALVAITAHAAGINLNEANAEQLAALDGIGPVKAEAIVDYREANGPFASVEELTEVDGIGPATLESNRDDVVVE